MTARTVLVPPARLPRWVENFGTRHGPAVLSVRDGRLDLTAEDGSSAAVSLPFDGFYNGPADPEAVAVAAAPPDCWGVLLVRKGGFAVARLTGDQVVESKVGRRHVQGRTKAGGQSQQRFARRRDNQARQAYEAAAGHAHRILAGGSPAVLALVCGGDRPAVDVVLSEARLREVAAVRTGAWLPVPDPRRGVLDAAVSDACSLSVTVVEPG